MYSFNSRIRYSEVDSEGKLSLAALINYFQDCSTFQSEDLGIGVKNLKERHIVWVLSYWQIVVDRYPELCENVTIGTVPYELKAFLGSRNFCMTDESGQYVAKANSLWSLLDTETGRPVSIPEDMYALYPIADKLDMEYAPRKIKVPAGGEVFDPVVITQQYLDTNHHVNNEQFLAIAMNYLPENVVIRQVRAEYKKQAFLRDVLIPRVIVEGDQVIVSLEDESGSAYLAAEFLLK
ncbi:MAG: thioesterase [Acetatifactor sp.]|nr:thioesterase [Acetatifactor sp.]